MKIQQLCSAGIFLKPDLCNNNMYNMRPDTGKTIFWQLNVYRNFLKTKSMQNISEIIIRTDNFDSAQLLQKISAIIICTENVNSAQLLQKISAILICTEDFISAQLLQKISAIVVFT